MKKSMLLILIACISALFFIACNPDAPPENTDPSDISDTTPAESPSDTTPDSSTPLDPSNTGDDIATPPSEWGDSTVPSVPADFNKEKFENYADLLFCSRYGINDISVFSKNAYSGNDCFEVSYSFSLYGYKSEDETRVEISYDKKTTNIVELGTNAGRYYKFIHVLTPEMITAAENDIRQQLMTLKGYDVNGPFYYEFNQDGALCLSAWAIQEDMVYIVSSKLHDNFFEWDDMNNGTPSGNEIHVCGTRISDAVITMNRHVFIPLKEVLLAIGAEVVSTSGNVSTLTYNGKTYVLNNTEKSFKNAANGINLLMPAPGSLNANVLLFGTELYAEYEYLILIFDEFDVTFREDKENKATYIEQK